MPQGRVRLHVPTGLHDGGLAALPAFYRRLLARLQGLGASVELCRRDAAALQQRPTGADFDLVHNGGLARVQALNLGVAYLDRFYYADPQGLHFESSLATAAFGPRRMPMAEAQAFFAGLQAAYVQPRHSRHAQPAEPASFGRGHIAIFLQDWSAPVERARYMEAPAMVAAVLRHRQGRRVVIKPHPRNRGPETALLLHGLAGQDVTVTDANIHDILAGAAVSVSISSAVALEGMLHRVPAVLFGRSDLHHCAETVRRAEDWPAALTQALQRDWPFEAFLFWFLRRRMLDSAGPFLPRLLERMAANGADLPALGLAPLTQGRPAD